jgi:hypothetical protein
MIQSLLGKNRLMRVEVCNVLVLVLESAMSFTYLYIGLGFGITKLIENGR